MIYYTICYLKKLVIFESFLFFQNKKLENLGKLAFSCIQAFSIVS